MYSPLCLGLLLFLLLHWNEILTRAPKHFQEFKVGSLACCLDVWRLCIWQGYGWQDVADPGEPREGKGPPFGLQVHVLQYNCHHLLHCFVHALKNSVSAADSLAQMSQTVCLAV